MDNNKVSIGVARNVQHVLTFYCDISQVTFLQTHSGLLFSFITISTPAISLLNLEKFKIYTVMFFIFLLFSSTDTKQCCTKSLKSSFTSCQSKSATWFTILTWLVNLSNRKCKMKNTIFDKFTNIHKCQRRDFCSFVLYKK